MESNQQILPGQLGLAAPKQFAREALIQVALGCPWGKFLADDNAESTMLQAILAEVQRKMLATLHWPESKNG